MNLNNADFFIDGIGRIQFNGQVLKLDLLNYYPDPNDQNKMMPRLVGRLAVSVNTAEQLRDALTKIIQGIKKT